MEYLTLGDFERYGGIKGLDSKVFERYEMKARRLIDRMTHNRLQGEKTVRKAVTMCMVELVGAMAAEEADGGAGSKEIASMSNDGVSVTYRQDGGNSDHRRALIVRSWLDGETAANGVNLLYAGVG